MNSLTLRGLLAEIASLRAERLGRIAPVDARTLRFDFETASVVVSAHPRQPALFVTTAGDVPDSAGSFPFARLVASALAHARLEGVLQAGLDRVAAIRFELRDRLGDVSRRHLIAELTGPAARLLLVEGEDPWSGRILGQLRADPENRPGGTYAPPASGKTDVLTANDAELEATLARKVAEHGPGPKALVQAWQGVSPFIAREILHRAGGTEAPGLVRAWRDLVDATSPSGTGTLLSPSLHPTLITRPDGTMDVECFVSRAEPGEHAGFPTLSAAMAEAYRRFRAESGGRSGPMRALVTAIDRTERALAAVDREAAETGSSAELRRIGEALLAHAHAMPRGVAEAEIPDPRGAGLLRVHLNPRLGAAENADLLFKKARKAERREPALAARRREILSQRDALQALRAALEQGAGAEPDPAWIREAEALGVRLPRETSATVSSREPADRLPGPLRPRRYDLGDGWEAMVGKSNRGNDVLTFELARPEDVWMHAHQSAGSHLVLRHHEKGKEPPRAILYSAASIAAYYSKSRGSSKVPVLVSQKRFVRKPRKAPIGTVTVSRYETLMVPPHCPEENGR
jgi:predicted ribosome quality control (RQC) complex YloA/Tae2 family protein